MTFQITPQHEAIFNWLEKPTTQAAIVKAVAGAGKSSTLQECAKRLTGLVLYLAFNASAVADISARGLPANVSASTLHSCGLRGFPGRTRPQVDGYKSQTIFRKLVREDSPYRELEGLVCSLVAKAKALGLAPEPYHAHALMPDTTRLELRDALRQRGSC